MRREISKKKWLICMSVLLLLIVLSVLFVFMISRVDIRNSAKKEEAEDDSKLRGEIEGNFELSGEVDPDVRKLSEINRNFLWNYEIVLEDNSYFNQNGFYIIDEPEIVERIITDLDSLFIKECDPRPYYQAQTQGLCVMAQSKDGSQKSFEIEILGKNEKGNYILNLAMDNRVVAEVVEGNLDYEYMKELYRNMAKEAGGTLEEDAPNQEKGFFE